MNDRDDLLTRIRRFHNSQTEHHFVAGVTEIQSSGACLNDDDRAAVVEAALDMRIAAESWRTDSRANSPEKSDSAGATHQLRIIGEPARGNRINRPGAG